MAGTVEGVELQLQERNTNGNATTTDGDTTDPSNNKVCYIREIRIHNYLAINCKDNTV